MDWSLIVFLPLLAAHRRRARRALDRQDRGQGGDHRRLFIGAFLSWPIFFQYIGGGAQPTVVPVLDWIHSGTLNVDWALRVDSLTAVMLVVVTSVSSLVHLYSWGYMEEDPGQPRFFAYLSLFSFAMLMLVTADSLVQMFFGWEGVGLASYLLIGFWYHKPSANAAALKAFVVNRIGDFGFSLGIFGTFLVFGTVSIPAILDAAPGMAGSTIGFAGMRVDTMTLLCLLLFVGAMGKSAQSPLHTWLPDAMEGPTPVSALIHAATMVTAGVFMVCRLSPMFEESRDGDARRHLGRRRDLHLRCDRRLRPERHQAGDRLFDLLATGLHVLRRRASALTARRCSICSPTPSSRRLLFLGAGSVIHAMHHEQDMRYYGAPAEADPDHLLGDGDRHAGDHRRRRRCRRRLRLCRLLVEGRDPGERLGERIGVRAPSPSGSARSRRC